MRGEIDLSKYKEHMKSYYLLERIYDIYYKFSNEGPDLAFISNGEVEEPIDFQKIILNIKTLDYIRDVNFVFLSDVGILQDIKEIRKIGILLNFEVFLDPNLEEDKVIFEKDDKKYELFIIN